jgi:hypothetical protein
VKKNLYITALAILFCSNFILAQKTQKLNLSELLKNGKISSAGPQSLAELTDNKYKGVTCKQGLYWIKDISFAEGTIELDMKGRDVLQQSFLGIAFHGADSAAYESVYLRPFNFRTTDTLRRSHAVQYVSAPDYPWERLRKEQPLVYEHGINPPPLATDWVHVRIDVQDDVVSVYLNHSRASALTVKKLGNYKDGSLGFWCFGSAEADFANLVIKEKVK